MSKLSSLSAQSLQGKSVAVLGLGLCGRATARLLAALGVRVFASDAGPEKFETAAELRALGAESEWGGHSERLLEIPIWIVSPGILPQTPLLCRARDAGILLASELELAWANLPAVRLCAVTGTNGKTTTTALIGHLLAQAGQSVFVGGNIGRPLCELAYEALTASDFVCPRALVLELSSYQCEQLHALQADVAIYLNLSPDHLERYQTMTRYAQAKAHLFELQNESQVALLNADDPFVQALKPSLVSQVQEFSIKRPLLQGGSLQNVNTANVCLDEHPLSFALDKGRLRGLHNRQNQLAAIMAAHIFSLTPAQIQQGLDTFEGAEHRLEYVDCLAGVTYYNDSKATNDNAAAEALCAFAEDSVIWLAGGKDKGGGYDQCLRALRHARVKNVFVYGEAAPLLVSALQDIVPVTALQTLAEAFESAHACAHAGDVILLSPACSSFDQYPNFEVRGRAFKHLVQARRAALEPV